MERYTQKYRQVWETDPLFKKWIRPSKDSTKAVCIYCHSEIAAKYYDLVRRSETKKHKKTIDPTNSSNMVQPTLEFTPPPISEEKRCQAMLALYTAVHSSFSSIDHLAEVCCKGFKDSKIPNINLHRTKCANIITNLIAPHFIEKLLQDIKNAKYSLILDEGNADRIILIYTLLIYL